MKKIVASLSSLAVLAFASSALADAPKGGHTMHKPDKLEWKDGPPALPKGSKMVVIAGDPSKPEVFTLRLKFPSGFKVMPHWHPEAEHVTVLEGQWSMGSGDKWDDKALMDMGPGAFMVMDKGTRHYGVCKKDCVVQLHAMGPGGTCYINKADDPRGDKAPPCPADPMASAAAPAAPAPAAPAPKK
jgi:hypothetical protein